MPRSTLGPRALDSENSAGHRPWPLPYRAAVIAGLYDPLSAGDPSRDHADMVRPNNDRANAWASGMAPIPPVSHKVDLWSATLLGSHPPAAPSAGPSAMHARLQ